MIAVSASRSATGVTLTVGDTSHVLTLDQAVELAEELLALTACPGDDCDGCPRCKIHCPGCDTWMPPDWDACDECAREVRNSRPLTRAERMQGLADSGCDTMEELRGER